MTDCRKNFKVDNKSLKGAFQLRGTENYFPRGFFPPTTEPPYFLWMFLCFFTKGSKTERLI